MTPMDVKKDLKHLYEPSAKQFSIVDVPPMTFLMIDGHGDPNHAPAYQQAVEALYTLAYATKFALKKQGHDYSVPPLEGLWWMENMAEFSLERKADWDWTMMIMQPQPVTASVVERVKSEVMAGKRVLRRSRGCDSTRTLRGWLCRSYTMAPMRTRGRRLLSCTPLRKRRDMSLEGKHHEIYLGDPRRTAPEKLKTVIRQPIAQP